MDVGQPKDFLTGTCLYLASLAKRSPKELVSNSEDFVHGGNVMIDPTAKIGKNCKIGPNVTIGANCVIGDGVRLQRCVLLENSKVKEHAWIKSTIVGWNSTVGRWARLENVTVLGDDVTIGDEIYVNGGSVLPHKSIKQNVDGEFSSSLTLHHANSFRSPFYHHVVGYSISLCSRAYLDLLSTHFIAEQRMGTRGREPLELCRDATSGAGHV